MIGYYGNEYRESHMNESFHETSQPTHSRITFFIVLQHNCFTNTICLLLCSGVYFSIRIVKIIPNPHITAKKAIRYISRVS